MFLTVILMSKESEWFKPKKYLHFDFPVKDSDFDRVHAYVSSLEKIAKHSFYPFITYSATKYKVRENDDGTRYLDDSGIRPLSYSSHMDSQIYSFYSKKLEKKYEAKLSELNISENILAFRKLIDKESGEPKCNIHLANDAFEKIKEVGSCRVFAFDVKSFFDGLNHDYLKESLCELLNTDKLPADLFNVFKSITSHSVVDKDSLYNEFGIPEKEPRKKGFHRICDAKDFRERVRGKNKSIDGDGNKVRGFIKTKKLGIPQGSAISALLANIYMLKFDEELLNYINTLNGYYYRYCDDLIIIIPSDCGLDIEKEVSTKLNNIYLKLNIKKTEKRNFFETKDGLKCDKPVQYLGFVFDGKRKYLRTSSISRYRRKAKKAIRLAITTMISSNDKRIRSGLKQEPLFKKRLYRRYTHLGLSNFIRYGLRAAKIMNSNQIKRQIKKLNKYVFEEINGPK